VWYCERSNDANLAELRWFVSFQTAQRI